MRNLLQLTWVLGAAALAAGCQGTNVGVAARGAPISSYQTGEIGRINTPAFAIGDVVVLNPVTHKACRAAQVQVDPMEIAFTQNIPQATIPFEPSFEFGFSQEISPSLKEQIEQQVDGQTAIRVENFFERKIKSPATFAAGSDQLAKTLLKLQSQEPDAKFFLVSSVTSATRVSLTFTGAPSNTIHEGKYQFHVNYEQNKQLDQLAEGTSFYKLTPLTITNDDGHPAVAIDKNFDEDMSSYDFTQAVADISQ